MVCSHLMGLTLILDQIKGRRLRQTLRRSTLDVISRAIEAENAHHLRAIEALDDKNTRKP